MFGKKPRGHGVSDQRTSARPPVGDGRVFDNRDRGEGGTIMGRDALDVIPTVSVCMDAMIRHYQVVVLREDQLDLIADAVVRRLKDDQLADSKGVL